MSRCTSTNLCDDSAEDGNTPSYSVPQAANELIVRKSDKTRVRDKFDETADNSPFCESDKICYRNALVYNIM